MATVVARFCSLSEVANLPASTADVVAFFAYREHLSQIIYASFRLPDQELLLIQELKTRLAARTLSVDDVASIRTALLNAEAEPAPIAPPPRLTPVCIPNPFALRSHDAVRRRFAKFPISEGRRLAERASRLLLYCRTCQSSRTDQHGAANVQTDASAPAGFRCSLCGAALEAFDAVSHLVQPMGAQDHRVVSPCCGHVVLAKDVAFTEERPVGMCTECASSKSNDIG